MVSSPICPLPIAITHVIIVLGTAVSHMLIAIGIHVSSVVAVCNGQTGLESLKRL